MRLQTIKRRYHTIGVVSLAIAAFVILSNLSLLKGVIGLFFFPEGNMYYTTQSYRFADFESTFKGRDLNAVQTRFERYQKCYPTDTVLYRTFQPRWWHFWMWTEYVTHPRYDYPYLKVSADHEFNTLGDNKCSY